MGNKKVQVTEHLEILDAILESDPDRAELAVRQHLQNAGDFVMKLTASRKE